MSSKKKFQEILVWLGFVLVGCVGERFIEMEFVGIEKKKNGLVSVQNCETVIWNSFYYLSVTLNVAS